jgi:DNA-binding NarL/FixJ family response regulator
MRNTLPASPSTPIHVALIEDDVNFQNAFIEALNGSSDLRLVAVATCRAEGLALLQAAPADVLVVDLGLPDGSGIDVIRAAAKLWPGCAVMVSTTFGDEMHVMQSLEAGAAGYLLKDSSPTSMVNEIRDLNSGGSPISPLIARQVLTRFRAGLRPPREADEAVTLSERERETLNLITRGFSAKEIAALMQVSQHTVQTYVRRIYSKLKVNSKSEAIFAASKLRVMHD